MSIRHRNQDPIRVIASVPLHACAIIVVLLLGPSVLAAPVVTSLALSPATIAGGTGGASTATVTLSEAAPAGGTVVTIGTSNPGLAASVQSVRVPAGATTASFAVATNAKYRRYSGLAFTMTISATAGGLTANATLNATAQPRRGVLGAAGRGEPGAAGAVTPVRAAVRLGSEAATAVVGASHRVCSHLPMQTRMARSRVTS